MSAGELYVQSGTAGPKIAVDDIESFAIADSGYRGHGMGARKNLDGSTLYKMYGDGERALRLEVRGRDSPIFLVCPEPEKLVDALTRAKAGTGLLIAEGADTSAEQAEAVDVAALEEAAEADAEQGEPSHEHEA